MICYLVVDCSKVGNLPFSATLVESKSWEYCLIVKFVDLTFDFCWVERWVEEVCCLSASLVRAWLEVFLEWRL